MIVFINSVTNWTGFVAITVKGITTVIKTIIIVLITIANLFTMDVMFTIGKAVMIVVKFDLVILKYLIISCSIADSRMHVDSSC